MAIAGQFWMEMASTDTLGPAMSSTGPVLSAPASICAPGDAPTSRKPCAFTNGGSELCNSMRGTSIEIVAVCHVHQQVLSCRARLRLGPIRLIPMRQHDDPCEEHEHARSHE